MKDIIEPAYEIYVRGYTNAARNIRNTEGGISGKSKFSIRNNIVDDNGVPYDNVVLLDTNIFNGIKPRNWTKKLYRFVYDNLAGEQIKVQDQNGQIEIIEFARANERVQKDGANNEHKVIDKLARKQGIKESLAVAHAKEVFLVSEELPESETKRNHKWLDENGWSHRKATIMDIKGNIYEATLNIAHTHDGRSILYDINKITVIGHGAVPSNSKSRGSHVNTNNGKANVSQISDKVKHQSRTDSEYLSAVERGDMETAQRMVDEAAERAFADSKIRDEDGNLVKVYHGTDADFTVFDRAMGRANMDIQGMFFSPWDIDAGGYGSNVRAFYLNITNPASESEGYKALNSHKGENYAGIKARENLERMGYDGVNNSGEEYIAFSSEQIKSADPVTYDDDGNVIPLSERFNPENKDIRYQERSQGYDFSDFGFDPIEDDGSIENSFAREYSKHSEDIGEVLKNIAAIDIAPNKVESIIKRVVRNSLGGIGAIAFDTIVSHFACIMI